MNLKKEDLAKKIVSILEPLSIEEIKSILEEVNKSFFGAGGKKVKDMILIQEDDPSQRGCGGKYCPFWHWTDVKGSGGAIDGVCWVSGDHGTPVMVCGEEAYNHDYTNRKGEKWRGNLRSKECLEILPISK